MIQRSAAAARSGEEVMKSLKQRPDLPARVRTLLEGMLERAANQFEHALSRTLDELEQEIFKLAERARSNEQQHARFEALREVKRGRADAAPRFLLHVESTLANIGAGAAGKAAERVRRPAMPDGTLELIDSEVLEEDLALQEVVSKSEIRHSQALYALSHRFGVLAASPAFEPEALPLGPAQLARALRHATSCLDLGVEYRVLAYRLFDRVAMLPIGEFYEVVNGYLARQRILAHLQSPAVRAHGGAAAEAAGAKEPPSEAEAPAAAQTAAAQTAGEPAGAGPEDAELFSTLRMLLSGRRRAEGTGVPFSGDSYLASRDDLQAVLGSLQGRSDSGRNGRPRDAATLRHDLLMQLKQMSPQGRAPVLAEEDSDTVDLVGMLFDYITKSLRTESSAQSLMTRLQVPVLRVALSDKTFFTQREHPARMLLNTIAETSSRWADDDDADPSLVEKMQVVVDKVGSEYNGDITLFRSLLGDLGQHMQLLARRAEVAERRHVDAAKGREKLDLARDTARTAIERLLKRGNPSPLVRTLLEQAWTDALALTILRQGEDSSAFHRRLAVADQLLRREPDANTPADKMLRQELDVGLSQVGLHGDDVRAVLGRLFTGGKAADDAAKSGDLGKAANDANAPAPEEVESATALALKLKSRARLGGEQGGAPRPITRTPANLSPEEMQILDRLKTLPFGTWFEFTTNQQGATVRRKLAWFSTLTGRCLFVNQRGARTDEKTMEQLARDMARKQVRIWTEQSGSLIDRAWKAIMGSLKQFSGAEAAAQGATA
jgi:pyruvate/2-oxoglutarate dehydrogenase complex dihydrolipoamide acyltransferase (E2) component